MSEQHAQTPFGLGTRAARRVWIALSAIVVIVLASGAFVLTTMVHGSVSPRIWIGFFLVDILVAVSLGALLLAVQRPNPIGASVAVLVPAALVLAASGKLLVLDAPATFGDLALLADLRRTLSPRLRLAADIGAVLVLLVMAGNLRMNRRSAAIALAFLSVVGSVVVLAQSPTSSARIAALLPQRFSSFPFHGHVIAAAIDAFEETTIGIDASDEAAAEIRANRLRTSAPLARRDVHIIMVESFVDPVSFSRFAWSGEPLAPLFATWRRESGSLALSPVFGNRSSNAEFEVLCGVPSVGGASGVTFLEIRPGAELPCLPRALAERGFATHSFVPNAPGFFDSGRAMRAVGFQVSAFAEDVPMSDLDGIWLSAEATLREQTRLVAHLRASRRDAPVFTYTFVNAGHFPYARNLTRRPDRVAPLPRDPIVHAWANGAHYNALALEAHVAQIRQEAPDALIAILGDHNPPLGANLRGYRLGGRVSEQTAQPLRTAAMYETPLLIVDRDRLVPVGRLPTWQLPHLLLDLLSDGAFCEEAPCAHRADRRLRPFLHFVIEVEAHGVGERLCATRLSSRTSEDADCDAVRAEVSALHAALTRMLQSSGRPVEPPRPATMLPPH